MHRYYVDQAVRAARLSRFEHDALLGGVALVAAAVFVAVFRGDVAGLARTMGCVGLAALVAGAASRGAREYRAGASASLPGARPLRVFGVVTFALALGLPLAAVVALIGLTAWGWLAAACVLLLGCTVMFVTWVARRAGARSPTRADPRPAAELLRRPACGPTCRRRSSSSRTAGWRRPGRSAAGSTSPASCSSCSTTPSSRRCSRTSSRTSATATRPWWRSAPPPAACCSPARDRCRAGWPACSAAAR